MQPGAPREGPCCAPPTAPARGAEQRMVVGEVVCAHEWIGKHLLAVHFCLIGPELSMSSWAHMRCVQKPDERPTAQLWVGQLVDRHMAWVCGQSVCCRGIYFSLWHGKGVHVSCRCRCLSV